MTDSRGNGLTGLGKLISVVLVLGLVGLGAWIVLKRGGTQPAQNQGAGAGGTPAAVAGPGRVKLDPADLTDTKTSVGRLPPPVAYVPAKGAGGAEVIDVELSKYAGYAGMIAANGGLAANPDSYF